MLAYLFFLLGLAIGCAAVIAYLSTKQNRRSNRK